MDGIKLGTLCLYKGYDEIIKLINKHELFMSNETYHEGISSNSSRYIIFDETPLVKNKSQNNLLKFQIMLNSLSVNLLYFSIFNTYLIKTKKENWRKLLTKKELDILKDYKNEKSRLEFIAGRGLLKLLIIAYHTSKNGNGLKPNDLIIKRDKSGKPRLLVEEDEKHQYKVCISHKDDYIFCGFHPSKRFGLDVEKIDLRLEKVKKYYLDNREDILIKSHAGNSEEYLESLAKVWASKESLVKYNGSNLLTTASNTKLKSLDGDKCRLNTMVKNRKGRLEKLVNSYNYNFDGHVFSVVI
jgi:phosphopantetheinyl transferase